jgi:hypothetical protein
MKYRNLMALCLMTLLMIGGCATTKVTEHEQDVTGKLPRPAHIWVYDFAATPGDLPIKDLLDKKYFASTAPQTAEHIAEGRKLGTEIETELVYELREMGMSADHAVAGTAPQLNDLVIQGYILSYDEGDAKKRIGIGLGSGASHLKAAVEGLQMTDNGLRAIGSESMNASGNKTPGMAVGLATMLATHNPAGLIVSTGMKVYDKETGKDTVDGRAKQTAKEIADQLKKKFQEHGWI